MRFKLYDSLKEILNQGYNTVEDMTEIFKLYEVYTKNGGNGEIKLLFEHVEQLPYKTKEIMDDQIK